MNRAFAGIKVRQRQFGVDNVDIFRRVHFPRDVNDIVVFEAANHVTDSFGFADVGQKLVAETFAFGRAFNQARDINELHGGRQDTLRFDDFSQLVQTRIGHRYDTGVRLNGTEGKLAASIPALVSALNRVDLPTLGKPTIPHLNPMI